MKTYKISYKNKKINEKKYETVQFLTFMEACRHAFLSTRGGMTMDWEVESVNLTENKNK